MKRLVIFAALSLLLSSAFAQQNVVIQPPANGNVVDVRNFGAKGDGQRSTVNVSIASGSGILTVGTSLFSSDDVGKTIVVPSAGVTPTTGPVIATPITSAGSGYTSVPTVGYTGTGTGASGVVFLALQSATVASGGGACTNGTQTFHVMGGLGELATLTGTVSGGVLSGALTVVTKGLYSSLPASLSAAQAYGPGCTTAPTLALSFGVEYIATKFAVSSGYDVSTTASLTGGSPGVAAVLGTPTINLPALPLVTTIASYQSATQVTLSTTASTVLSAVSKQVFWGTDNTSFIQSAINYAVSSRKSVVYFPTGTYFKACCTSLDPGTSSLTFRGDGMEASVIEWDGGPTLDSTSGTGALFLNASGGTKGNLLFEDLQFRGFLDEGRIDVGGPGFYLNFYNSLDFSRVKLYQVHWFGMQNEGARNFRVTASTFDTVMRAASRCRSCFNVIVNGNYFIHSDDDSVDLHQASYITSVGNLRKSIVVSGNIFEDTDGIAILGGREVTVTENICRRCKFGAIRIGQQPGSTESPVQTYAVLVANNQAFDTLVRPPFDVPAGVVFSVLSQVPRAGSVDATLIPGMNVASTTQIIQPWPYMDNDIGDATKAIPPAYGVTMSGNRTMRTLPAVAAYSTWGYGQTLSSIGFIDPKVPEPSMTPTTGVLASLNVVSLNILNNEILNNRRGISVQDDPVSAATIRHVISGNTIYDAWEYGIFYSGTLSNTTTHAFIRNNQITLDPYRISPGRVFNGSWTSSYTGSIGISSSASAFVVTDNSFEELYQPISGLFRPFLKNNIVIGQFTSTLAWNALNYGVATVPSSGDAYQVYLGLDTSSTAQLNLSALNNPKNLEQAAMPTSGAWFKGDFVKNNDPATTGTLGWTRLTNGTANVAGTDWISILANGPIVTVTPTTGQSITVSNTTGTYVVNPAGTLAALTITLPASGYNVGDTLSIPFNQIITSLTISPNSGQTVNGAALTAATVALGTTLAYRWVATNTWQRLQ